jgi:quercetin dioxygenase-like cupin family protein
MIDVAGIELKRYATTSIRSEQMKMRMLIALCAIGLAASASAATSTTVLKTSNTWNGADIDYFGTKCPEVDAVIVDIPANAATSIHLHPVNNYAYILEGEVTVVTGDVVNGQIVVQKSETFKKGDAFAELVNTWHKGTAGPEGVKILVWYTTEAGYPFTVVYSPDYKVDGNLKDSSLCLPPKN